MTWYPKLTTGLRIDLAVLVVAATIAAMWWISVKTASRYEARSTEADPVVNERWPLTQSGFWKSKELLRRHRNLHAAGAAAVTALILSRPAQHMGPARVSALVVAVAVLLTVLVTLCLPLADRHVLVLGEAPTKVTGGTWWCRALFAAGAAVFVAATFTRGWPDETGQNTPSRASRTSAPFCWPSRHCCSSCSRSLSGECSGMRQSRHLSPGRSSEAT
jgi:hypothetical protein